MRRSTGSGIEGNALRQIQRRHGSAFRTAAFRADPRHLDSASSFDEAEIGMRGKVTQEPDGKTESRSSTEIGAAP
jgi:hypothetical protein